MISENKLIIISCIGGIIFYLILFVIRYLAYKLRHIEYKTPNIHPIFGIILAAMSGLTFSIGMNGLFLIWEEKLEELIHIPGFLVLSCIIFVVLSFYGVYYTVKE